MVSQFGFSFSSRKDIYDEETGVYARWYFEQRLDEECSRARRSELPITLACVSVDAGSALTVGLQLRRDLRDYDLVGRLARGRFVVAVLDSGVDAGEVIVNRLQATIGSGCDLGLACFPTDGADGTALLAAATRRMLSEAA